MMADLVAFPKLTDLGLLLCDNDRHKLMLPSQLPFQADSVVTIFLNTFP